MGFTIIQTLPRQRFNMIRKTLSKHLIHFTNEITNRQKKLPAAASIPVRRPGTHRPMIWAVHLPPRMQQDAGSCEGHTSSLTSLITRSKEDEPSFCTFPGPNSCMKKQRRQRTGGFKQSHSTWRPPHMPMLGFFPTRVPETVAACRKGGSRT